MSDLDKSDPVDDAMDDWGSAMAEQASATAPQAPPQAPAVPATGRVFQPLQGNAGPAANQGGIDRMLDGMERVFRDVVEARP